MSSTGTLCRAADKRGYGGRGVKKFALPGRAFLRRMQPQSELQRAGMISAQRNPMPTKNGEAAPDLGLLKN